MEVFYGFSRNRMWYLKFLLADKIEPKKMKIAKRAWTVGWGHRSSIIKKWWFFFWIPNYFLSLSTHSIRFSILKKKFNTTEMMVLFFVWQRKNAGPDIWATSRWESSSCRGDLSRFLESVSLIFNKFEEIFYDNFILQKREN